MNTRIRTQSHLTKHLAFILGFLHALSTQSLWACSDVIITGNTRIKPLPVVSARTMEFFMDLKSQIVKVPRGIKWVNNAGDSLDATKPGVTWTNQYGFVGINQLDQKYKFAEGINEMGLSVGLLWLTGTDFPVSPDNTKALSIQDFAAWALGQFQSVAEVKAALNRVVVVGETSKELGGQMPNLHAVLHDASGKSMVIEWMNKGTQIYDDDNQQYEGVMTNSPDYALQLSHLYLPQFTKLQCGVVNEDEGLKGMPGDFDAKSRFVVLAKLRQCATHELVGPTAQGSNPLLSENDTLQAAAKLIGRVENAKGETYDDSKGAEGVAYTQWTVLRVHGFPDKNGRSTSKLYFRSAENNSLRLIDLANLDFTEVNKLTMADLETQSPFMPVEDPSFLKAQNLTPSPTECLFDWAERKYYDAFLTHETTKDSPDWTYRCYSKANTCLFASKANNNIDKNVYFKDKSGNVINEGPLDQWLSTADCKLK